MKILFATLVILNSIQSCGDLKIIECTSQNWSGGITGSPGGVSYRVSLLTFKNSEDLKVDQLWIKDDFYSVNGVKKLPAKSIDGFADNDTIYIRATKVGEGADKSSEFVLRPDGFEEEWLIGYMVKGKRKYLGVRDITILKPNARP